MQIITTSMAIAVCLAPFTAQAKLNHPVINPTFPGGGLNSLTKGLTDNLKITKYTWSHWATPRLPSTCKRFAQGAKLNPMDVFAFTINYEDCSEPWVFCRHKDSPISAVQMIETFGRLPVHTRQYVRHMLAVPGNPSAFNAGDNIQLNGGVGLTVFIHEAGHSLDHNAFSAKPFHDSKVWLDAYNKDTAVPDSYAQTSQTENFAQQVVVAMFNKNVPGGVGTIQPNWRAIGNEYHLIQDVGKDLVTPGGKCTHRLANDPPVAKSNSAKIATSNSGSLDSSEPEKGSQVNFGNGITELTPNEIPQTVEVTEFDANGNPTVTKTVQLVQ